MKVQAVKYAMLRKTDEFENDRVEVTIELERGDTVGDAVVEAKRVCTAALEADQPETVVRRRTFEDLYQQIGPPGVKSPLPVVVARNGEIRRVRRRTTSSGGVVDPRKRRVRS